jgi:hypothetical protein
LLLWIARMTFLLGSLFGGALVFLLMRGSAKLARRDAAESAYIEERAINELHIALGLKKHPRQPLN